VAVFAVVHEAGFQRGLDARDDGFVDVALALFAPFDFDFVVEQFLPVHNGQPALFGLRGVDQHAFHDAISFVQTHKDTRVRRPQASTRREPAEKANGGGIAGEPLTRGSGEAFNTGRHRGAASNRQVRA